MDFILYHTKIQAILQNKFNLLKPNYYEKVQTTFAKPFSNSIINV